MDRAGMRPTWLSISRITASPFLPFLSSLLYCDAWGRTARYQQSSLVGGGKVGTHF